MKSKFRVTGLIDRINYQITYLIIRAHTFLMDKVSGYDTPRERRFVLAGAGLTFASLVVADAALAQDGFAGMAAEAGRQADSIKSTTGKVFTAAGFAGAGYGGYNWWHKGKEGEQSQIKGSQIFGPFLAGAALGATGFVLLRAGESIGINSSQQGQLPS